MCVVETWVTTEGRPCRCKISGGHDGGLGKMKENKMKTLPLEDDLRSRFAALGTEMRPVTQPLITLTELDEVSLFELVHGRCLAVRVKNFIPESHALEIANKLLDAKTWDRYETEGAHGIEINGKALFECGGNRTCAEYFDGALPTRRAVRRLLAPLACPMDQMQAELDSAWKPGTQVLTLSGKKCHVGLQRCFRTGGEALHHNDRARIDFNHPKTARMQFQLGINTYLSMAAGGELELWNLEPDDALYDATRYDFGPTYAIRAEFLPEPDLVIRPVAGDFIIFNAAKIHRVRPVLGDGVRVTVSAFAGFFSINEPFHIFS
jgi:hypothetical protein